MSYNNAEENGDINKILANLRSQIEGTSNDSNGNNDSNDDYQEFDRLPSGVLNDEEKFVNDLNNHPTNQSYADASEGVSRVKPVTESNKVDFGGIPSTPPEIKIADSSGASAVGDVGAINDAVDASSTATIASDTENKYPGTNSLGGRPAYSLQDIINKDKSSASGEVVMGKNKYEDDDNDNEMPESAENNVADGEERDITNSDDSDYSNDSNDSNDIENDESVEGLEDNDENHEEEKDANDLEERIEKEDEDSVETQDEEDIDDADDAEHESPDDFLMNDEEEDEGENEVQEKKELDSVFSSVSDNKPTESNKSKLEIVSSDVVDKSKMSIDRLLQSLPETETSLELKEGTIEYLVAKLIQPELRKWIDENLYELVEKVVQQEISKLVSSRR